MSKRLLCSCGGFCGASEREAGAHVTCRLADGNLERIRRLFSNLSFIALRVKARGDGPFVLLPTIAKLTKMPL